MMPRGKGPVPFRFCVATGGAQTAAQWCDLARRAEDLGYDLLTFTDHVDQPMAPFTALAMAAAVTTTLRLGTYVACQDFRGPVILAKEFATLDILSGGRAEIGIGAGWREVDYTQAGIPFDSRPQRFERFIEYVEIIGELLGHGPVTYQGRYFTVTDAECVPSPVQRHIPMLIGGSRRRTIELAAKRADVISIAPSTSAEGNRIAFRDFEIDTRLNWVRSATAHRDIAPEIDIAIHECWVLPQAKSYEQITRLSASRGIGMDEIDSIPSFLIGSAEQVTELLIARRERWGVSRVTIPAAAIDAFAPVVAKLAGR